ncbi:hypothetical protein ACFX2C_018040 [Malus domestica]
MRKAIMILSFEREGEFVLQIEEITLWLEAISKAMVFKNVEEIEKLKKQMKNEFEMKDLGEAKKILGMEITRDREKGLVSLNQRQYLEKLIRKFGVHDSTKPLDVCNGML